MKILFCLLDGFGDRPIAQLNGQTPLERANTPTLNRFAFNGQAGTLVPAGLGKEIPLASASLMLFSSLGYDIRQSCPARGIVEAIGAGLKIKNGDLAMRCNFATVDKELRVVDRRAGRADCHELENAINGIKFDVPFEFKATVNYRGALVFRGEFSDAVTDVDPNAVGEKVRKCEPKTKEAVRTAELVNDFVSKAHEVLERHAFNKGRALPANFLVPRAFGSRVPVFEPFRKKFGFKAVGLNGMPTNEGICRMLGIDSIRVKEDIGDMELEEKRKPLGQAMKKYDFVLVHFKNTDKPGHDGEVEKKILEIERTDAFLGSLDLDGWTVIATSDHATPCELKAHSADPFPTLFCHGQARTGEKKFCEKTATDFKILSHELMPRVFKECK